eukprot:GFKZ01000823.1.p2 GENE.GFKZ01000823.1~~GFKZ01000823.1.p2  ORF type:complete len:114 (-),score=3.29 GFKZ01000823.1:467-808(-)
MLLGLSVHLLAATPSRPREFPSSSFTHPSAASKIQEFAWSMMLRRHLDLPVYEDSSAPLRWHHCHALMDPRGHYASICKTGFGVVQPHNKVRIMFVTQVYYPAGLACQIEVPF